MKIFLKSLVCNVRRSKLVKLKKKKKQDLESVIRSRISVEGDISRDECS